MPNLTRKQLKDAKNCKVYHDCEECEIRSTNQNHCIHALAYIALVFLDMLKRCASEEAIVCPICGIEVHLYGHTNDCELNNILKEVEG